MARTVMQEIEYQKINKENYLTYDELANILKVSKYTLRNWVSECRFKAGRDYIKLGPHKKSILLFKKDILKRVNKIILSWEKKRSNKK
ncbi:hypothetical protein DEFDS_P178 (plasmid) [Deferribacter desulfuricans SSM1]|uniref:Uncharacterized protein n=1 Tax=Deferribacter desulfuricans (strain DSM 14783 / JCM 11476 / NBRC 101012 / SSM1) TaxID=639282 RepID=D3PF06_DEFDS|nr:helix-turn-helix domain-containing protein [Deferribacter desulfuricans]BAI81798.1 hypothetical protein DEFDS_P178 [Deferribacter desulfuricans SSM1]